MVGVWIIYGIYMVFMMAACFIGHVDETDWRPKIFEITLYSFGIGMIVAAFVGFLSH